MSPMYNIRLEAALKLHDEDYKKTRCLFPPPGCKPVTIQYSDEAAYVSDFCTIHNEDTRLDMWYEARNRFMIKYEAYIPLAKHAKIFK